MTVDAVAPESAVVVGATGGVGRALVTALAAEGPFAVIHALSRSGEAVAGAGEAGRLDLEDEGSIAAAAERIGRIGPVGLVIVATGLLHGPSLLPEKSFRTLDPDSLAQAFRVNAIGPALVAKHMLPLLPRRGRAVFAALSARVGSIADNRLGGWYGYRASKAALNQILRTLAIETARTRPDAIVMGLHPGTVDTGLSRPYQAGVAAERLFTPAEAAGHLLRVVAGAGPDCSGGLFAWDGSRIPF